jgi:hypothetical protein
MNLIDDYRKRNEWLHQGLRPAVKLRTTTCTIEEVADRMNRAMADPAKRLKALRNDPLVVGNLARGNPVKFDFTGYRYRQWVPSLVDPNEILKPKMVGTLVEEGGQTSIAYSIDVRTAARRFYILMALSLLLLILAAVCAVTLGFSVPSLGFFALLCAGVCFVFAKSTLNVVPDAMLDEEFLEEWLSRLLN